METNLNLKKIVERDEMEMEVHSKIMTFTNVELNSLVKVINFRRSQVQSEAKDKFKVGEKVYFLKRGSGRKMDCTILKINRKNILVDHTDGITQWNVSPTMLFKQEELDSLSSK
jgi:hypothetical protein